MYAATIEHLTKHAYPTIALDLPSVGAIPPHKSFDGDVKGIRDCVTQLVSDEKEVVVVAHSYSGMPAGEALSGLGKKERQEKNLKGGVVRLVFVMAYIMPENFTPPVAGTKFPDWMQFDWEVYA